EKRLTSRRVTRHGGTHERETCLAVVVREPRELLVEDVLRRGHVADRQIEREVGLVCLGKRQTWNLHVVSPEPLEPGECLRSRRDRAQGAEPRGLLARGLCAIQPGLQEA